MDGSSPFWVNNDVNVYNGETDDTNVKLEMCCRIIEDNSKAIDHTDHTVDDDDHINDDDHANNDMMMMMIITRIIIIMMMTIILITRINDRTDPLLAFFENCGRRR